MQLRYSCSGFNIDIEIQTYILRCQHRYCDISLDIKTSTDMLRYRYQDIYIHIKISTQILQGKINSLPFTRLQPSIIVWKFSFVGFFRFQQRNFFHGKFVKGQIYQKETGSRSWKTYKELLCYIMQRQHAAGMRYSTQCAQLFSWHGIAFISHNFKMII